jgi:ribosomal protein S10
MSLDWVREHIVTNATKGGAPMGGLFVLPSGRKKLVSLRQCFCEISNVLRLAS